MPKISDLPTDTAPDSADIIPFVDVTASRTESVTVANLAASTAFAGFLKADVSDQLTAGFDSSDYAKGTVSSGTYTLSVSDGPNFIVYTNGGAHTLAPPTTSCSLVLHITNNGSAGAITTSGFTLVEGHAFTTTDTHEFVCVVTKINDVSVLTVKALQ